MAVFVKFISDFAPWIYAACAVVAVLLLRVALLARQERRQAVFSLEKEAAVNRTHRTLRLAIALAAFMGAIYVVSNYLTEPAETIITEADPTPTPVFLIETPTPTPLPSPTVTPTATATPRPRATPRPIPTAVPVEPTVAVIAPSCPDRRAVIIQPGSGQVVNGPVSIVGTATTNNFQYYKIEFKPAGVGGDFSFYLRREVPVQNGPLGVWDSSGLPPGDYLLRLVTVDHTGNFGDCTVQVTVGGGS